MSRTSLIKVSTLVFLSYIIVSILYNSKYTLWGSFYYDNQKYKYTVFNVTIDDPIDNSTVYISACLNDYCKYFAESSQSNLTWIDLFEREFNVYFENKSPDFYDKLMRNHTSGFNITIENPGFYLGSIIGFYLFIIFI